MINMNTYNEDIKKNEMAMKLSNYLPKLIDNANGNNRIKYR